MREEYDFSQASKNPYIEKRFAQINARAPEHLTAEEAAHLAEAERIDDGSTVSLDDLKKEVSPHL